MGAAWSVATLPTRRRPQQRSPADWRAARVLFPGDVIYAWHGGLQAGAAQDNVTFYDLSQVQSDDKANHNKFVKSSEMVQIVADRLAAGETLTDTHEGLGDKMLGASRSAKKQTTPLPGALLENEQAAPLFEKPALLSGRERREQRALVTHS